MERLQELKNCSECPHQNDCQKVGSCLNDINAQYLATRRSRFPRLMTPAQANAAMAAMVAGQSKRQFTQGKSPIVTSRKLRKHCASYSTYGAEIARLSEKNITNVNARKSANSRSHRLTAVMCMKGLHRMTPDNIVRRNDARRRNWRQCKACYEATLVKPPLRALEKILPKIEEIKRDILSGASISQICHGRPTGGGKVDRSLARVRPNVFQYLRQVNPDFNRFMQENYTHSLSAAQKIRWSRIRTRVRTTAAREEANDFYKILAMVPESIPDRREIVGHIFEDMLAGALNREDVPARVRKYVADFNREFPTKYRRFGDSPLLSLDEVMFDDGSATRGDTVSRGLWD
jgi:hypothetical protein